MVFFYLVWTGKSLPQSPQEKKAINKPSQSSDKNEVFPKIIYPVFVAVSIIPILAKHSSEMASSIFDIFFPSVTYRLHEIGGDFSLLACLVGSIVFSVDAHSREASMKSQSYETSSWQTRWYCLHVFCA